MKAFVLKPPEPMSMHQPATPRIVLSLFLLTFASVAGAFAFGSNESPDAIVPDARPTPDFGRLTVAPLGLVFRGLNFKARKPPVLPDTRTFIVENSGRSTNALTVDVDPISGPQAAEFSISPPSGSYILQPGKASAMTFTVTFAPVVDGRATAEIVVSSISDPAGIRGVATRTVRLVGVTVGPIPSPTATATTVGPTATATATATATGSAAGTPTATSTSSASPTATSSPGATDRNSANALGVFISGTTTVNAFVPEGSDNLSNTGTYQVVIESAASPLPSPTLITTDRVNSCAPSVTGQVVCSGQTGTVDLVPAAATSPTIQSISPLPNSVNYADGDCIACGAMVDDVLGLSIVSTGSGFLPVTLSNGTLGSLIATNTNSATGPDPNEVPGMDFGYDAMHHRILSANFQVTSVSMGFMTSTPHFQIIDISTPASPVVYDLTNDFNIFEGNSRTCGSPPSPSDDLPDTTAYDTSTQIAYVSFHNKATCNATPPDDIAMFDMSQATFNATTHEWTTPSFLIQSITGTALNGIDSISVESKNHLAMLSGGDNNIGVLQLPAASGGNSASLAVTDWVNANMPNDPDGVAWSGWGEPNGVATYVSPNTGKVIGVLMNNPAGGGGSTYLALIDMEALLAAPRDTPPHQILTPISSPIVTFVKIK